MATILLQHSIWNPQSAAIQHMEWFLHLSADFGALSEVCLHFYPQWASTYVVSSPLIQKVTMMTLQLISLVTIHPAFFWHHLIPQRLALLTRNQGINGCTLFHPTALVMKDWILMKAALWLVIVVVAVQSLDHRGLCRSLYTMMSKGQRTSPPTVNSTTSAKKSTKTIHVLNFGMTICFVFIVLHAVNGWLCMFCMTFSSGRIIGPQKSAWRTVPLASWQALFFHSVFPSHLEFLCWMLAALLLLPVLAFCAILTVALIVTWAEHLPLVVEPPLVTPLPRTSSK